MKKNPIIYFLFTAVFCFLLYNPANSQDTQPVDIAMTISLENNLVDFNRRLFRFDIYLIRTSPIWHLWENATMQMALFKEDSTEIDYSLFDVNVDVSTSEVLTVRDGLPAYKFYSKIIHDPTIPENSRVKLMVIGPEEEIYSRLFELETKLKLCVISIQAKDPQSVTNYDMPVRMEWKKKGDDELYYQETSYTYVDSVNTVPHYVIEPYSEDHIEIGWITELRSVPSPPPFLMLSDFWVEYVGNKHSVCRYGTLSEINNAGFVIKRGSINFLYDAEQEELYDDLSEDIFSTTVADYRWPRYAERMKGQLYTHIGKEYEPIPDTLQYRQVNYVYRLYYDAITEEFPNGGNLIALKTRNLLTPNSVITLATPSPNPSAGRSTIEYYLDDDVFLSCNVYDQNGGHIKVLSDDVNGVLDMTYVARGRYTAKFEVPELASQGLYEVYFIAYPVNDKSVELSTANVKITVIRDYHN